MNKFLFAAALLTLLAGCTEPAGPSIPEKLAVPENVVLHSATETSLTFQWNPVVGAERYGWLLTEADGSGELKGSVTQRNVMIPNLRKGTDYLFWVRAEAKDEVFEYCSPVPARTEGTAPAPGGDRVCADAPLVLTLEAPPVLGSKGFVKIFKAGGDEVDRIDLADISGVNIREDGTMVPRQQVTGSNTFTDKLPSGGNTRLVHYTPFRISGNSLVIRPHCMALDFDTEYYVTVDESVCGKAVAAGEWKFTTKPAPSTSSVHVAADGSGDFCTLQRALCHVSDGAVISMADGSYEGLLYLRNRKDLSVKGDSRDGVRIVYPNCEHYMSGSSARCLWLVENCDNLILENLTIENSFGDLNGQAEAIYFNSGNNTHRLTIENCSLLSYQDTFLCKGSVWVHNSLIAGHCDFIWGYPKACLFENCEIRSRAAGYIVQARVKSASDKGFVFLNCKLTAEKGVKDGTMYLARSSGQADCYDNVSYIGCTMSPVIAPAGWYPKPEPNPSTPNAVSGWKEYASVNESGTSASGSRNAFGRILTAAEAAPYLSREAVLGW